MNLDLIDRNQIAAAAPIRAGEYTPVAGQPSTNLGTGQIFNESLTNLSAAPGSLVSDNFSGLRLVWDKNLNPPTGDFEVFDGTGAPFPGASPANQLSNILDPSGTPNPSYNNKGTEYSIPVPGFGDITFSISGDPTHIDPPGTQQDSFVIEPNIGGVDDNRNALEMANLKNTGILDDGNTDLQGAYSGLVANVGVETRQSEIQRDGQESLLKRAQEELEATSGVNLDEEAANMMRFQQAYQAAAQTFAAADQIFQELISAVRS